MKALYAASLSDGVVAVVEIHFDKPEHEKAVLADWRRQFEELEAKGHRNRVAAGQQSIPVTVVEVHPIKAEDLPPDRRFRDAWKLEGRAVGFDMGKAREIHRERLRKARAPLFAALDVEYQRADEAGDGDSKRSIAARKQWLRDITKLPEIDQAATIEELAKVWPDELK